jgi:glucose-6-phosphate isomerase
LCAASFSPDHVSLGANQEALTRVLAQLDSDRIVQRIWEADHTVWNPDPTEISDRLGWLTLLDTMRPQLRDIQRFATEVGEGIRHVVLLGTGGSSLGPETLKRCFGAVDGAPELLVLDSTVPSAVQTVTDAIDVSETLFVVSSKSGSTIEPNFLYRYFRGLMDEVVGTEDAGRHFVAITDAGSSLDELATDQGFRRVFQNPEDLGGRYSVLSYFGLVPVAMSGIDISVLSASARSMEESCEPHIASVDNPGLWLGAVMASLAQSGRDKLTLVTSKSLSGFGLWVEQLIAESLGKDSKGIVPVTGEPLVDTSHYGDDRAFVFLKLADEESPELDEAQSRLESAGHPMVIYTLGDLHDLGGEFYRWEFATAVAGHILSVHPFNQPNVQQAKDLTETELLTFQETGTAPDNVPVGSLQALLESSKSGDYLAILAYIEETDDSNRLFAQLRRRITGRTGIATTLGYGPRYLHSTGQLHKAGPNSGLFLQVTSAETLDIEVPGEPHSLKILVDAQSAGDGGALSSGNPRFARVVLSNESALESLISELDQA